MREGQVNGPQGTRSAGGITLESQWVAHVWEEFQELLKRCIAREPELYGIFKNFKLFVSCKGYKDATRGNDLIEAWTNAQYKVSLLPLPALKGEGV